MRKPASELAVGDETMFGPVTSLPDLWPNGRVYVGFPKSPLTPMGVRGFDPREEIEVQ